MKPKDLNVGDKVFLVKYESFLSSNKELEVAEVTKVTGSSVYVDDTRFPIKATFPLVHRTKNMIDRTQHLWLTKEDYLDRLKELRLAKEKRVKQLLSLAEEGLNTISDEQLDKLRKELEKVLVSLNTKKGGTYDPEDNTTR